MSTVWEIRHVLFWERPSPHKNRLQTSSGNVGLFPAWIKTELRKSINILWTEAKTTKQKRRYLHVALDLALPKCLSTQWTCFRRRISIGKWTTETHFKIWKKDLEQARHQDNLVANVEWVIQCIAIVISRNIGISCCVYTFQEADRQAKEAANLRPKISKLKKIVRTC